MRRKDANICYEEETATVAGDTAHSDGFGGKGGGRGMLDLDGEEGVRKTFFGGSGGEWG